ncbi:hypothetical protein GCWU000341_00296 [Oribacterium sp. oral taxon 078 str. F0262]|nr:hypothetical protein GCWU000341_00296 [Oribacterium sp. oral taxon 078 str. F0262]
MGREAPEEGRVERHGLDFFLELGIKWSNGLSAVGADRGQDIGSVLLSSLYAGGRLDGRWRGYTAPG